MRFLEGGPSIPDELLLARDQGRVVFFCGAGVSRAKAGLPDFFGLTEKVIKSLGVASDSPVHKVLEQAWEVQEKTNVPGLISADRLFGLLEREFYRDDIEKEVAQALHIENPDLTAHQTMIDLATTPTGLVRLVTTNFDRLFNDCNPSLQSWQPPNLPSLARPQDMNGIVYLHGRASEDYSCAEEDGFILSSAEFGRAYLAEAWATEFFKEILSKYIVVFVGYGADDPPVHYLLEALSNGTKNLENIYAFQDGTQEEARSKWQHKGVEAIAYDPVDHHKALWLTLELWAERARDSGAWYQNVMSLAAKGPKKLEAFERGMVAHVASSTDGAKLFANANEPPTSEWLLVFDRYCRYHKPARIGSIWGSEEYVDPFELYGLDSDSVPEKIATDDFYAKREQPDDAWDVFELNHIDRAERHDSQYTYLRGYYSSDSPDLCTRLRNLSIWISKLASDPITLWWARRQVGLHPFLINQIEWHLDRQDMSGKQEMAKAWRYFIEAIKEKVEPHDHDWYQLQSRLSKESWTWEIQRKYLECLRPRLAINDSLDFAPIRDIYKDKDIGAVIVRPEIHYPNPSQSDHIKIPDEWLMPVMEGLRQQLAKVIQLESAVEPYSIYDRGSLTPEDDEDDYLGNNSVFILLLRITRVFDSLLQHDLDSACMEYQAWGNYKSKHFLLLRVWGARNSSIVPIASVKGLFVQDLDQELFWSSSFSRDSLLTLQARWSEFSDDGRRLIEELIIEGPLQWDQENDEQFQKRKSWSTLDRLHWLNNNGCNLLCDLEALTSKLKEFVPSWDVKSADNEVNTGRRRGGVVRTDTNYSALENLSPEDVLASAELLRGRTEDFLVEAEPFKGYIKEFPLKAHRCLSLAAKQNKFPDWAWQLFLGDSKRVEDKPRLMMLLAERLSRYADGAIDKFIREASRWLDTVSKELLSYAPKSFYRLFDRLLEIGSSKPELFKSGIVTNKKDIDWVSVAINSPVSPLLKSLFDDPRLEEDKTKIPSDLLNRVKKALGLEEDISRYALVICNHNLGWYYAREPEWTQDNLLCTRESDLLETRKAFWSGFFWGAKVPNSKLFRLLKPELLSYSESFDLLRDGHSKIHSGILLAGWKNIDEDTGKAFISSEEFREFLVNCDDKYRSQVLWQIKSWATADGGDEGWKAQLELLLKNTWPKQITVKSPATTSRLCEIAFSSLEMFERLGVLILPHLVKMDSRNMSLPIMRSEKDEIVQSNPELVLAILYKVLSDSVRGWPYQIEEVFDAIEESNPDLKFDDRMIEIRRKWNSR